MKTPTRQYKILPKNYRNMLEQSELFRRIRATEWPRYKKETVMRGIRRGMLKRINNDTMYWGGAQEFADQRRCIDELFVFSETREGGHFWWTVIEELYGNH